MGKSIWDVFIEKTTKEQLYDEVAMVKRKVESAISNLELIRDTFPTYTLHNAKHSENVLRLMGELLGDQIEKITPLEGAILILAAYYHDIGMVFKEELVRNIGREPDFKSFVKQYPSAYVEIHRNNNEIPIEIAEWYCRWIHPKRSALFISDDIRWEGTSLKTTLINVCLSHGENIEYLLNDNALDTNFLGSADLKFCALLLRLADILDFDNSRSPIEIYEYIGIANRANHQQVVSDIEWCKHMDSQGFKFHSLRVERYELRYAASCKSAMIEHEIREFLNIIEDELNKCDRIIPKCSDRWRSFKLPYCINRNDIQSEGYKYGDFHFSLEQNQVINLLMGENLYDSPYIFLRELLQNAIDTVRHRKFYENSKGNAKYQPKIEISTWYDSENCQWIRIDDNGMGMNESKILEYFLRVGKSFYNSSEFEVEKISYKESGNTDFTPISRFGIGILSCFIVGDSLELNTKHILDDEAARLSVPGLQGFYNLQIQNEHYYPAPMPSCLTNENFYRDNAGTSIAVKLNPAKTDLNFDIKEILKQNILFPSVEIEFDGEKLCELEGEMLIKSHFSEPIVIELDNKLVCEIEHALKIKFNEPPRIKIFSLNLSEYSPTSDLKGMFLMSQLDIDKKLLNVESRRYNEYERKAIGINIEDSKLYIIFEYRNELERNLKESELRKLYEELERNEQIQERREKQIYNKINKLEHEIMEFNIEKRIEIKDFQEKVVQKLNGFEKYINPNREWISHNGIVVPTNKGNDIKQYYANSNYYNTSYTICSGILALSDSLRPNFTLARDKAVEIPWNVVSTINLAYLKAIINYKPYGILIEDLDFFRQFDLNEKLILEDILKDPNIGVDKEWAYVPIIQTNIGIISLMEIRDKLSKKEFDSIIIQKLPNINEFLNNGYSSRFIKYCIAGIVQVGLCVKLKIKNQPNAVYVVDNTNIPNVDEGLKLFPPLFFVSYEESAILRKGDLPLNINHPFSKWLIDKAIEINKQYPGILKHIKKVLSKEKRYNDPWKEDIINDINQTLGKLRKLNNELVPPSIVYLKAEDFND